MQWPVSVFPFNFINQDANLLGEKNTLEDSLEVEDTENTTQENKRYKNEKEEKSQPGQGQIRNEPAYVGLARSSYIYTLWPVSPPISSSF